jgi:hypothetical protein
MTDYVALWFWDEEDQPRELHYREWRDGVNDGWYTR